MPALKPTDHVATITWIGHVPDRAAALASQPQDSAELGFEGIVGEAHGGLTRPSCSRVIQQYPRGTEIRNTRQLAVLSDEELLQTAQAMGLEALDPAWVGASLVISGLADFSHIPPSSRLQAPSGATIVVDMENRPCQLPAKVIAAVHPDAAKSYKSAATGRRGVTAWVERPGRLAIGDQLRLHVPDQPQWAVQF